MTQLATRDAEVRAPTGAVTVADLLSRYGPVPADREPNTGPVSVQSLLIREGATGRTGPIPAVAPEDDALEVTEFHGELAGDAPDAEYDARYEHEDDGPRRHRLSGITYKRTAIAAGVLVAAGSVVGATVATTPQATPAPTSGDQALPETPSRSWLDPAATVPAPSVAPVVTEGALDAGEPVDTSWMQAAFPAATAAASDDEDDETADAADDRDAPAAESQESPAEADDDAGSPEPTPVPTPAELVGEDDADGPDDSTGDDESDTGGDESSDGGSDDGGSEDGGSDDGGSEDGGSEDGETAGRGDQGDQDAETDGSTGTDEAVADGTTDTDEQAPDDAATAQL